MAPKLVEATNLDTGQKLPYTCTPEEAVVAAYAQEHDDWNTWDYKRRYGHQVSRTLHFVACGSWTAPLDGNDGS